MRRFEGLDLNLLSLFEILMQTRSVSAAAQQMDLSCKHSGPSRGFALVGASLIPVQEAIIAATRGGHIGVRTQKSGLFHATLEKFAADKST